MAAQEKRQRKRRQYRISGKDRESFISSLALLLNAGVPIGEALESLKETSKAEALHRAIDQMRADVDDGTPLWSALAQSGIASGQTVALAKLGEESGNLIQNLQVAAAQEEKQRAFKQRVRSALMYPGFVLSMTLFIGIGVAWFLLPQLSETFRNLNLKLPWISQVLINIGVFLKTNGIWAVPSAIIGLILFGVISSKVAFMRTFFRMIVSKIPGIGRLLKEVEVARFGYLFGTLLDAGLSITQALQMLYDSTADPRYKKMYRHISLSITEGFSIQASLASHKATPKLLPPAVRQMIAAGERSGSLSTTLLSVGKIYEEKADTSTRNLETILEPVMLLVISAGVLGVAIAVIMPIYGLIGGLNK